jgi:inosose dehydratase
MGVVGRPTPDAPAEERKPVDDAAKKMLEQCFNECKFLGYDYVENFAYIEGYFKDNAQELIDIQKRCGVELVNLYGHFGFDEEAALETAKKQVKFLADVGGKWYNCQNSGFGDDGPSERPTNPEMIDAMCRITNKLGEYANSLGVRVCFHPHYGTCVYSQEDIDYFYSHTDPKLVAMCIDTAHTTLAGIDPVALVKQMGKRIEYVHLKDVDTYAMSQAEGREKMASFRALGLGTVNFPAVKAALEEVGYDGVLCVELDRPAICNFKSAEISRQYIKLALGL